MKKKLTALCCLFLLLSGCQTVQPVSPYRYTEALAEAGLTFDLGALTAAEQDGQTLWSLPVGSYLLTIVPDENGFLTQISLTAPSWDKAFASTAKRCATAFTQEDCTEALNALSMQADAPTRGSKNSTQGDFRFSYCRNEAGAYFQVRRIVTDSGEDTALTLREPVVPPPAGETIPEPTVFAQK